MALAVAVLCLSAGDVTSSGLFISITEVQHRCFCAQGTQLFRLLLFLQHFMQSICNMVMHLRASLPSLLFNSTCITNLLLQFVPLQVYAGISLGAGGLPGSV
jgi:hypothetical protein